MRIHRWAVVLLVVAACGGSPGVDTGPTDAIPTSFTAGPVTTGAPDSTTGTRPTTTGTTGDTPTTPATPATTGVEVPGVIIAQGEVDGPGSVEVTQGEEAAFAVTSDVELDLHVHGYDLVYEVGAGETVEVRFVADVPGIFEVETHPGHLVVVNLVVEP